MKNHFSIRQLEQYSGVKAHTLRTWELRYGLLSPERTETNLRFYSLENVRQLLNISLLCKSGLKISAIAGLSADAVEQKLADITDPQLKKEKAIGKLVVAMYASNTEEFEMILDSCVLAWGIDEAIDKIVLPFLERVSLLSYADNSPETHFAVTAIRRKIILGIEKVQASSLQKKSALLFLPKGEHFDLILLYLEYKLRSLGIKTFYLGTNISLESLKAAAAEKAPDYLVTYLPPKTEGKYIDYLRAVRQRFPQNSFTTAALEESSFSSQLAGITPTVPYQKIGEAFKLQPINHTADML